MSSPATPKTLDAREAATILRKALAGAGKDFTIADAAAKSGLALRDAERGLHALVAEYRGRLRITNDGEVLFHFPTGFSKPWVVPTRLGAFFRRIGRALAGVGRFVLRAWIAIAMVFYVLALLGFAIAALVASAARSDSRDDGVPAGEIVLGLIRVVAEAAFWMFHPWSPFAVDTTTWSKPTSLGRVDRSGAPKVPFYERVNRFVFGPTEVPFDTRDARQKVLAEIRLQKGRIGLSDVMRVTGMPREQADPLMSTLMLDFDGSVEVSNDGGITYHFADVRKTVATGGPELPPLPIWANRLTVPPVTGNPGGTNFLITLINGINLALATWATAAGLTLENIGRLFTGTPIEDLPATGIPVVFGLIPLLLSLFIFALPIGRRLTASWKKRRIAQENGRRALLRVALTDGAQGPVSDEKIRVAWREASGTEPDSKTISREIAALGGDVDLEASGAAGGSARYRFPELRAEAAALRAERERASDAEARPAGVVYEAG